MFDEFIKEIMVSIIAIVAAMIYFLGNDGLKAVLFLVVTIYAAEELAKRIQRSRNGRDFFDYPRSVSMGDVCGDDDIKGVI